MYYPSPGRPAIKRRPFVSGLAVTDVSDAWGFTRNDATGYTRWDPMRCDIRPIIAQRRVGIQSTTQANSNGSNTASLTRLSETRWFVASADPYHQRLMLSLLSFLAFLLYSILQTAQVRGQSWLIQVPSSL